MCLPEQAITHSRHLKFSHHAQESGEIPTRRPTKLAIIPIAFGGIQGNLGAKWLLKKNQSLKRPSLKPQAQERTPAVIGVPLEAVAVAEAEEGRSKFALNRPLFPNQNPELRRTSLNLSLGGLRNRLKTLNSLVPQPRSPQLHRNQDRPRQWSSLPSPLRPRPLKKR